MHDLKQIEFLDTTGVDVREAQGIMRHSRASTTQDLYQQLVPETQQMAVRKLTAYVSQAKAVETVQ